MTILFDLGVQLERTALAWRRTALSVAGAAMGGARLITLTNAPWAAGVAIGGLAAAAVLSALAGRRYAAVPSAFARAAASEGRIPLPGGEVLAALAVLQVLGGLLALILLLF